MSTRKTLSPVTGSSGFSLFEVVVAVSVFAAAALLGTQALHSTFWMDRALEKRQSELEQIGAALMLMRRDLRNAITIRPVPSMNQIQELQFLVADNTMLASERDHPSVLEARNVIWQYQSAVGVLRRAITTDSGEPVFATLLQGVERLQLETLTAAPDTHALVKLHIDVQHYGRLTVVEHML